MSTRTAPGYLAAAIAAALPALVHAAQRDWLPSGDGTWQVEDNWSGGVPGPFDDASFNTNSAHTVTFDSSPLSDIDRLINSRDNVTLSLGGRALQTMHDAILGTVPGNTAELSVQAGTLAVGQTFYVGGDSSGPLGSGVLHLPAGGTASVTGALQVYNTGTLDIAGGALIVRSLDAGSANGFSFTDGTVTVAGGMMNPKLGNVSVFRSPSPTTDSNSFEINGLNSGVPTLELTGGSTLSSGAHSLYVGHSGHRGIASVAGVNSLLSLTSGAPFVGCGRDQAGLAAGEGTLTITNGGQVSGSSFVFIGTSGGKGVVTVDGSGSKLSSPGGGLQIGDGVFGAPFPGEGTLTISSGGQASSKFSAFAGYSGGRGVISIDGTGSKLSSDAAIRIGTGGGEGTLTLSNAGQALSHGLAYDGYSGGKGMVSVQSGALLNAPRNLYIGYDSTSVVSQGTLDVTSGGSVSNGGFAIIGGLDGAIGLVTVGSTTAAASIWTSTGSVYVGGDDLGNFGKGTLIVTEGGIISTAGTLRAWNSTGTSVNVNGGSLTAIATVNDAILIQGAGSSSLGNLDDSATTLGSVAVSGGIMSARRVRQNSLSLSGSASASIAPDGSSAATSRVNSLSVTESAKLDLNDNALIVDYTGATPLANIMDLLTSGYAGSAWTGNGITSTSAVTAATSLHKTALGFAESSALFSSFPATFRGQTVDDTSILIGYTLTGDANLDGTVDTVDFNLLAASFSQTGTSWFNGDFDYNGSVDTVDFNLLASSFSLSLPSDAASTVIPEPISAAIAVAAMTLLVRRRRV